MDIKGLATKFASGVSKHLPTIATCVGVGGIITTIGLTIKIAPKAKEVYDQKVEENPNMTLWEKTKVLAPMYWPVAASGAATAGCFIFANSVNLKRNAAAIAAYQLSEAALNSFKDAAVKTVGEKKTKDIEYAVAEDKIKQNPISKNAIIYTGNGDQLCYDSISGRYFASTREKILQAVNVVNQRLITENTVNLNEFYDLLDLAPIELGDMLGWNAKSMYDLLNVTLSSHITEEGKPALVIEYDITPTYDYYDF